MPTVSEVTRISLKNILFPTDFSAASNEALPFALAFARMYGSTLVMAHALPPDPHLAVVLDRVPEQDNGAWQETRQKLDALAHQPMFAGIPCKQLVDRGDLSDIIPAIVGDEKIDMIVLGTHGRRGVCKVVLGSSAEKIYRSAPCPVLTIGPKAAELAPDWKIRSILCPVDISADPEVVLHYALSLAEENQALILLMEAIPLVPWQHRDSVGESSRRNLESLIPPHARDWCSTEVSVRWEHPADAILKVAAERRADLIVMSVHKSHATGLSSHLPWPIASEVVSRARCPVLTVRV